MAWPHLSLLLTRDQRSGRGRLDRSWTAAAGTAVAVSVAVGVAEVPMASRGWIPLLAGAAMTRAVQAQLRGTEHTAGLKWPNDVLLDGGKVCGILAETVPADPDIVVVGAGVNTTMTPRRPPCRDGHLVRRRRGRGRRGPPHLRLRRCPRRAAARARHRTRGCRGRRSPRRGRGPLHHPRGPTSASPSRTAPRWWDERSASTRTGVSWWTWTGPRPRCRRATWCTCGSTSGSASPPAPRRPRDVSWRGGTAVSVAWRTLRG